MGADLAVMGADALRMRVDRPFIFSNLKSGEGVERIASFVIANGALAKSDDLRRITRRRLRASLDKLRLPFHDIAGTVLDRVGHFGCPVADSSFARKTVLQGARPQYDPAKFPFTCLWGWSDRHGD